MILKIYNKKVFLLMKMLKFKPKAQSKRREKALKKVMTNKVTRAARVAKVAVLKMTRIQRMVPAKMQLCNHLK